MTRCDLHDREVATVASQLRAAGHEVIATPRRPGTRPLPAGDLLVDGQSVGVLVSRLYRSPHHVTVGGRPYVYTYEHLQWNFQVRSVRRTAVAVWLLVWRSTRRVRRYVVPAAQIGSRHKLDVIPLRRLRDGRHWLAAYADRWDLVGRRRRSAP